MGTVLQKRNYRVSCGRRGEQEHQRSLLTGRRSFRRVDHTWHWTWWQWWRRWKSRHREFIPAAFRNYCQPEKNTVFEGHVFLRKKKIVNSAPWTKTWSETRFNLVWMNSGWKRTKCYTREARSQAADTVIVRELAMRAATQRSAAWERKETQG